LSDDQETVLLEVAVSVFVFDDPLTEVEIKTAESGLGKSTIEILVYDPSGEKI
jgi:hypothetical protein